MVFKLMLPVVAFWMMTSCVPRERIVYFQGDLESIQEVADKYSAVIQPDDLLDITVFAKDQSVTKDFNQESSKSGDRSYLVDEDGYIEFPVLGKIKLAGMTRSEAMDYMKEMLKSDILDPGVSIKILNYKITILGEVGSPGSYTLDNEKTTLLEAIGMAGDLSLDAVRDNILVIREEGGQRNFYRVNLTSTEVFSSPVYYLAQNDVIYVEPNKKQINSTASWPTNLSLILSITSFILMVVRFAF